MFASKRDVYLVALLASQVSACPGPEDYDLLWQHGQNTTQERRWFSVGVNGGGAVPNPWENDQIPYCFVDDNSETQLAGILTSAWNLWKTA